MDSDSDVMVAFRGQIARAFDRWRPEAAEVRRFQERLQLTLERVTADPSPLTLIEQSGSAIAESEKSFEAFGHLSLLEVYAGATSDERMLRYCKLVSDVTRILGRAHESAGGAPVDQGEQSLVNLRLAGRTIAAVAAMDRDEPRAVDGRLLELASGGGVSAAIAGLVLQMLADLRGEVPS